MAVFGYAYPITAAVNDYDGSGIWLHNSEMGKSKAEIQKAYRERKKQKEGEAYLKKERERVKGYYVPIEEKPQRKANERRKKVLANNLEQTKTVANNLEQCSEISSSSDVTSTVNIVTEQLIVKLPSLATKKRTRTRVNRANAKHRRTIADLTDKNELLNRKIRTVSKQYQRLINREKKTQTIIRNPTTSSSSRNSPSTSTSIALTPRKRTIQEIREEGLTPHKVPKKIQEKLLFANVITEEIGAAWKSNGLSLTHEVAGTMQVHCVVGVSKGIVKTTVTSCYCEECLIGNFHDYSESNILKGENAGRVVVPEKETNINQNEHVETAEVEADRIEILIAVDQFVAAIYDNAWHVGKITDIDETDKECQVNFLRPSQGRNTGNPLYKWPNPEDKIWLQVTDILCNIREPNKVGRSGRSFEIDPQDYRNACSLLQLRSNT
ncbi:Hypothetical predicted protein [Mytilus galloprovincialis]|uniref:Uncharacterized protein n=1 Tax=Mytilus galloprovincialis TaxID=29158 RepID=A0A8B6DST3_MYTGA|nr:Hypothetical predicted protein [Mytilus galloprovincialis]